ncbi:potassium-transporting ATPase subunit KdpC [Piscirickettsia litoralis]|uniref:Potassium-transporting ATPase KdpC subunit n=1 Tax=Piscirickettsia litoralis TaxID=1891921 RepID=A0ABX3A5L3_9GAMM|nr:potassium-transporting ATPase subunit KdpC [Piscirickettsia litoralis]ODN43830.1 potassium-transporting ATPase subunit C [Piscirickettsia litoralis]
MFATFRSASVLLLLMTLTLGLLYPGLITLIGQALFPFQANGSILYKDNEAIGSALIAQPFSKAQYFHPRPSSIDYQPMPSSGSNLGPTNENLIKQVETRQHAYLNNNPGVKNTPIDAVTTSGSGIDPDISLANAYAQAARIASVRHKSIDQINQLIKQYTVHRQLGFLGEPHVNVLELNLALDHTQAAKQKNKH